MRNSTITAALSQWPSRDEVAKDAGVEPVAVRRWEERGRIPSKHFAALLCGARRRELQVEAHQLAGIELTEAGQAS
jgi:transcriptional regulator with XRE-family HTH domain